MEIQAMKSTRVLLVICIGIGLLFSCKRFKNDAQEVGAVEDEIVRPDFSADSAYAYVAKQVEFGPRVPGSTAHKSCFLFLKEKMNQLGAQVIIQEAAIKVYNGKEVPMYNLIATYNPQSERRILLCAHWDSRPFADQDTLNKNQAIDGANDGASGVGVLMEIARQLNIKRPEVGVDIIFFDVEDYGQPEGDGNYVEDSYALGTQYWTKAPHVANYNAENGILLDMVGASDALFTMEGISMQYASEFNKKVWDIGAQLGYSDYFNFRTTESIIDDHYYINKTMGIPTIDIIHKDLNTASGFWKYWHTNEDNLSKIDKNTLKVVGETVLATVYSY